MTATCKACGTTWAGLSLCHCSTCHRTFTSVDGFDRHRIGSANARRCDVTGMTRDRRGYWVRAGRERRSPSTWASANGGQS